MKILKETKNDIKNFGKLSVKDKIFIIFVWLFLIGFIAIILYPIIDLFVASLCSMDLMQDEISHRVVYLTKFDMKLPGFRSLFSMNNVLHSLLISCLRVVIGTCTGVVADAVLAYILSRRKLLFKNSLTMFFVITLFLYSGLMPMIWFYKKLGLTGTFAVYIIPSMVNVAYMLILKKYMEQLDENLEDAARLDGAGYVNYFLKVVCPMCKPAFAVIALFIATDQWNSWIDTMIFNRLQPENSVFIYEIIKIITQVGNYKKVFKAMPHKIITTGYNVYAAAAVIVFIPALIATPLILKFADSKIDIKYVKKKDIF